jgi:hypothetical protein
VQFGPDFCRREQLAANPMAWMISVNGFIVDARTMPPEVQAEARRRGRMPDLLADRIGAGRESHEGREAQGAEGGEPKDDDTPAMARGGGPPRSSTFSGARHDSLPESEVKVIEKAIAGASRGWSDAHRRSIECETDSGMTDDDDDDALCDTSFNWIGYALQVEMLDEVTHAGWRIAAELKKATAKRPPRKKARIESNRPTCAGGEPWTTWLPSGNARARRSATRRRGRSSG